MGKIYKDQLRKGCLAMDEMTAPPDVSDETSQSWETADPVTLLKIVPEYEKVEGWLKLNEAEALFDHATVASRGCIVEIGCYRGRSTVALCAGSIAGAKAAVFAIDPHEPFIGIKGGHFGPDDRRAFFRTMLNTKMAHHARLLNASSLMMAGNWDQKIALLLIDGDHRIDAVHADFTWWMPHLIDGATVIFKDAEVAGPANTIKEFSEEGILAGRRDVGTLAIFEFKKPLSSARPAAIRLVNAAPEDQPARVYRDLVQSDLTAENIAYHLYYGGDGKYLYQPIPKCACTSIKAALLELEGLPVDPNEEFIHRKAMNKFPGMMRLSPSERADIYEGRTNTFKFVIVRDPYTRMASAYRDKITMPEKNSWHWIEQVKQSAEEQGVELSESITFEEFVRVASAQSIETMDSHWRPQYFEGRFGTIKFDYIGRMEMLSSDWLYIMEQIGAPEHLKRAASKPQNVTGAQLEMWSEVSPDVQAEFLKTYAIDFDTLCYPTRGNMNF